VVHAGLRRTKAVAVAEDVVVPVPVAEEVAVPVETWVKVPGVEKLGRAEKVPGGTAVKDGVTEGGGI
jgi:hypothetical protein